MVERKVPSSLARYSSGLSGLVPSAVLILEFRVGLRMSQVEKLKQPTKQLPVTKPTRKKKAMSRNVELLKNVCRLGRVNQAKGPLALKISTESSLVLNRTTTTS